jgi:hypothetical protein
MKDKAVEKITIQGFELLCAHSKMLAILPLEDWLKALNQAEIIAPVVDPTLYLKYRNSLKAELIKELLEAAIPLKRVVEKWKPRREELIAEEIKQNEAN